MKTDIRRYFAFMTASMLFVLIISCSGRSGKSSEPAMVKKKVQAAEEVSSKLISLVSPEENAGLKLNGNFIVRISPVKNNNVPDSIKIYFDGKSAAILKQSPWEYLVPSAFTSKTGRKALKVVAYKSGEASQTITRFLVVYADVPPKRNSFRVIRTFPHDRDAFTQGLVYENGILYEGTGQEARSSLRKVRLETGEVLNQLEMGSQFFGEGIALFGEKIYQLTWQSKVGFVYEKSTFKQINRVYYQTEGWGLTTMGDKLVMSDGTNMLYFMDPESFTTISTIEVYDNKSKVMELNELEYINGEIWANIWMTDLIARIDPSSGKVIAYIDLKGILKDPSTDTKVNVLNGIAYDQAGKRIFVTGKNWPSLFEIKLTE
jgi:glutaminyl-peptide cyclotransferase